MEYLRKTNKIFKLWNILINAIVITLGIVVVDYLNIPSQIIKNDSILISSIFIALIMLSFIEILKSKKYKLFVAKSINILDKCVFMTLFIELIYSIYLINDFKTYKFTILLIFFGIILCIFIWRLLYINNLLKKQKSKKSNMFDLKEFIETDIKINTSKNLVLFSENDVKYDLLNRGMFVDYIASLIKYCNPEKSFVFALNGAWESGKSTILNLVKNTINSEEMIIIDDFDPWKYNDSETLFRGFYDSITKNENFNFDYTLYKKIYNVYKVLILGNDNILNKIKFDLHFKDNNYSVNELKNIISTYLKINNKKVVFIIDNIDRLNKEQILVIFKTVSNLFDFDNFVYILSFDEKRVEKIFENELKIDSNYLNKIINSNVYLPKVNNNIISEIAIRTIKKMYLYYNIKIDNDEEIRFINMFSQLSSKFQDIRELKRFLNYISAFMQSSDIQELINMSDFIMIQLIKYLNINLYNTIYNTPMFFISEDINLSSIYQYDFFFAEKFNTMAKEFYQKLFNEEENKEYKTVLANLFPYINNFASGYQIRTTIPYNHDQNLYNTSVINKRICNGRYFEHYFDLTPNKYSELLKEVNEFIENFNNLTYNIDIDKDRAFINVKIDGEDARTLIGYRGEVLNALQTILNSLTNQESHNRVKVILNISNYKEKREQSLIELSDKIAKTVVNTGKTITLEPMMAYERKIIHTRLQNNNRVSTYSVGEEPYRKVVIAKKK